MPRSISWRVAGSPCAKSLIPAPYSIRCVLTPVQSSPVDSLGVGERFGLFIARRRGDSGRPRSGFSAEYTCAVQDSPVSSIECINRPTAVIVQTKEINCIVGGPGPRVDYLPERPNASPGGQQASWPFRILPQRRQHLDQ